MFTKDKIVSVENFIKQDDVDTFINYAESILNLPEFSSEEYRQAYRLVFPIQSMNKEIKSLLIKLEQDVWKYVASEYALKFNVRAGDVVWKRSLELVRWNGMGLQAHRDGHESVPEWEDVKNKYLSVSALIYLTDDFDGGSLLFDDFEFEHKPKALSLVIFPSYYLHEVTEIHMNSLNIPRYTLPFFFGFNIKELNDLYYDDKNILNYEYGVKSLEKVVIT